MAMKEYQEISLRESLADIGKKAIIDRLISHFSDNLNELADILYVDITNDAYNKLISEGERESRELISDYNAIRMYE